MRIIVHISDLHFGRIGEGVMPALVRAIDAIAPDLVAVSGDLTQRARKREFLEARSFLDSLRFAKIVVPGNHDVPLFNIVERFMNPLGRYRRYITGDLEPVVCDSEMIVVGLNSARSYASGTGGGRLNIGQVDRAVRHFSTAGRDLVKIVVTHHPFDLPAGHRERLLLGRANMAMARLAPAGADLFLAGHLHLSHVGHAFERYKIAGHRALVVQAGTLSTRARGEPSSFNVLRVARPRLTIERHTWQPDGQTFAGSWSAEFQHGDEGWT
jgi:3',5'-cyclic AMP phosphodiesterase CpdA